MADDKIKPGNNTSKSTAFSATGSVPGAIQVAGPGLKTDVVSLKPAAKPKSPAKPTTPETPDTFREIVETIVFVVVLVMILKTFLAEAFVIPTGSMATTLYGYQMQVTCPQCGFQFPVNCSQEADPQDGNPAIPINYATCENCNLVVHVRP